MDYGVEISDINDTLNQYLGESELVRAILIVRSASSSGEDEPTSKAEQGVHILAVVSSSENVEEEGSVFIFKPVPTHQPSSDTIVNYQLLATLPLTNALKLSMAQSRSRSGTIDLRPGKYDPTSRPAFTLTLGYGRRTWIFLTESSEALGSFISEGRRLIDAANASSHMDFRWLSKYQSHRQLQVPTLFPRHDLRQFQKPAWSGLSPATAGQENEEESDTLLILDEWLRTKLADDRNIFTGERSVRIRIGTFNVNGKAPSQDLSPWIRPQHIKHPDKPSLPPLATISPISMSSFTASDYLSAQPITLPPTNDVPICDSDGEPDVYVLGFQELDLSTEALLYSYNTTREEMWLEAILASLGEVRGQYSKLISRQLVGMLIICIVKKELVKHITDVRACAVGTGIMGVMGNKGAVALRFTLQSTVMTFVDAHLAAFDEYTERRNADFHDLSRRLLFTSSGETSSTENAFEQTSESIFQSDVLFWMGDLNYRIDLPDVEVRQLIGGSVSTRLYDIRDLLGHDQLTKARLEGKAFEDFKEGEISDLPSYRFSAGVSTDSSGYDTKRRPAWTDRILYQFAPHIVYRQTKYSVHPELTMSDHKPVAAEFDITVRQASESEYYTRVNSLVEHLEDLLESEVTPKVKVVGSEFRFGDARYKQKANNQLLLQNAGNVPCAFRFVSTDENEPEFPPWLSATPQMGIILPKEELSITLTVFVDEKSAPALNTGQDQLEHTLILHTMRGKDHFITINGDYKRTCFANDLGSLVRLSGPIRGTDPLEESTSGESKIKANAPREILRLINWLMTNATDIPDLFISHGDNRMRESIRDLLDIGEEFQPASHSGTDKRTLALSYADVLFEFFLSLPSSVIPAVLQERCAQVADRDEAFELISTELPGYVLNVWISLTAFLHYIAQQKRTDDEGKTVDEDRATILACIFAPVLLRDEPRTPPKATPLEKRRFLLHFIQ